MSMDSWSFYLSLPLFSFKSRDRFLGTVFQTADQRSFVNVWQWVQTSAFRLESNFCHPAIIRSRTNKREYHFIEVKFKTFLWNHVAQVIWSRQWTLKKKQIRIDIAKLLLFNIIFSENWEYNVWGLWNFFILFFIIFRAWCHYELS